MHPDEIVRLQRLGQFVGEMFVDPQIARQVAAGKFRQVQAVMQDRPQHAVGEAVIIFVEIRFREVADDIGIVALVQGLDARLRLDLAATSPARRRDGS